MAEQAAGRSSSRAQSSPRVGGNYGDGRHRRGEAYPLPQKGNRSRPGLVGQGFDDLRVPGHQLRHTGTLRVHIRRSSVPQGPVDNLDSHLGGLGVVPGDRLHRPHRHDPARGRRLCLAEPDPRQWARLRHGRDGVVVHPLAVGAHLRKHPFRRAVPATVGDTRVAKRGGLVGFAVIVILLLVNSHASFVSSFNSQAHSIFGVNNAYGATKAAAVKDGFTASAFGFGPLGSTMLLVPAMMFFILWPNWGATLYGEIRGASDFKRVFAGMFGGLWASVALTVVFLLLIAKTFGWAFYQQTNAATYNLNSPIPIWPYPVMFAGWLVHNAAFQVVLILLMSLWFFGWVGTRFLTSTLFPFAAPFHPPLRDAPEEVSEKR